MLGLKFIKVDPSTYLIKYRNGKIDKEGAGLSLFYYAPSTSLVSVPVGSEDVHFMFGELTKDFQVTTVQGQVTYRVEDVHALTSMLNYTLDAQGEYASEDHKKLPKRILSLVQVSIREQLSQLNLKDALASAEVIGKEVKESLKSSTAIKALGLGINELSIVSIKPNQETARALEAETREVLLRQADEAVYQRRNAAIEQERVIKENELNTEIAMEDKKREVMERQLEAEKSEQEKRQQICEAEMAGDIVLQQQNAELVDLTVANQRKESDAKAYAIEAHFSAIAKSDPRVVQILAMSGMNPAQLIASSFKDLAENADKIGELNISPDLLKQIMREGHA